VRRRAQALAATLTLAAAAAMADGVNGLIEEDFSRNTTTTDSQSGSQRTDTSLFTQRYQLAIEKSLFENLRFQTGGLFEQDLGDARTDSVLLDQSARTANFFGNLVLASPGLGGALGYTHRQASTPGVPGYLYNDEPSLWINWRPIGLPVLSLRLSRPSTWDSFRQTDDLASELAIFTAQYSPVQPLDLRYSLDVEEPHDHLHHTDSVSVTHNGVIGFAQNFAPWATSVAANLNGTFRRAEVTSSGAGGTIAVQLFPIAALSLVEAFPAVSSLDQLQANPALLDGNLTAGAGIDLGFSAAAANDNSPRDIGVQFADGITRANTLYVWVDRPVPQAVAATLRWSVWASDDNQTWVEVGVVGEPVFPPFLNRFEITFPVTARRYLKAVAAPLQPAATTDQRLADILVTEVQVLLVQPAVVSTGWQHSDTQLLTAALRTQVLGWQDLAYDFSLQSSRAAQDGADTAVTWLVSNGLTWSDRFARFLVATARVARQDLDQTHGHESALLYSGSLSANELPTLSHSLTASGQANTNALGTNVLNAVTFLNRAALYRGVALMASLSWSAGTSPTGQSTHNELYTVNASLQLHPAVKLGGTWSLSDTDLSGGGAPALQLHSQRLDGTLAFNPFPALSVSGEITRNIGDPRTYTLTNFQVGFSPFQGGDLQLTFNMYETADTTGNVNRVISPMLRWTLNHSTVLTAGYSIIDSDSRALGTHTRSLDFNLKVPL